MAFFELVFPINYSIGAIGGCGWSTRVVTTDAGFEYRQGMWSTTRGEWHVGHNLRTPAEWGVLVAFHRLMGGKLHGFRYRDWTDYTNESGPGVGDRYGGVQANPVTGTWQLYKNYELIDLFGTHFISTRFISKPEPGTVTIMAGTSNTPRTGYVIDYTTGALTTHGTVNPSTDTWLGNFHVPVRFDTDRPDVSVDLPVGGAGWRGIPVVEIRVAPP